MAFNPKIEVKKGGEGTIEELGLVLTKLLKPKEIDVRVVEYDDKRSQNERLIEINRNAAAAAGTTEKYSEGKLEELVEGARLMQKVARLLQVREFQEQMGIADLKEFTDDAEKAYPSSIKTEHPDIYYANSHQPAKINDRTRNSRKKKGFGK